jgi:hypothetical protein
VGVRIAALVLLVARIASADPADDAAAHFKKGSALYDLGKFDEAIVELEAAYTTDPNPKYLFATAQAHRFAKHWDKAVALYRRYLDLKPDDPRRPDIEGVIVELEKQKADAEAAEKARKEQELRDNIARDQAEAQRIKAELEAKRLKTETKRVRISVDVGTSLLWIQNVDDSPRSPSLVGRIGAGYLKRHRGFTFDFGGSWQMTTSSYEETDGIDPVTMMPAEIGSATLFFTQLHATVAASHKIAGPLWGRLGIGAGFSAFGNLKEGNPVAKPGPDVRMFCVRTDSTLGYRLNPTIDLVLGLVGLSWSPKPGAKEIDLAPKFKRTTTVENFQIGVFIKI